MIRILGLFAVIVTGGSLTAGEPIPAKLVSLPNGTYGRDEIIRKIAAASEIKIEWEGKVPTDLIQFTAIQNQPFWSALEAVMTPIQGVFEFRKQGNTIIVKPGNSNAPSSIDGPFRIVAKSVVARNDLVTGKVNYDVTLEICWEPRFPVFRIDSQPTIINAVDDRGVKLICNTARTKSPIGDGYLFTSIFRLDGLTRDSKAIAKLEGSFYVTASPKILSFTFDDLNAKLPVTKEQDKVLVSLTKFQPSQARYDAEIKLVYPENHPDFESFESWADGNKLKLISPDRTKQYEPENFAINGNGRKLTGEYRFFTKVAMPVLTDRTGWTLVYETPAPLTEFFVKFSLKDILLP